MASIRKRGGSYLIVVSMGCDYNGNRRKSQQKTVTPPAGLTPKQTEKWLNEQAVLFERECKGSPKLPDKTITLEKYIDIWLKEVAPNKLAVSTLTREKQDIVRILPHLGHYKLSELRPEHFRKFYADMRITAFTSAATWSRSAGRISWSSPQRPLPVTATGQTDN